MIKRVVGGVFPGGIRRPHAGKANDAVRLLIRIRQLVAACFFCVGRGEVGAVASVGIVEGEAEGGILTDYLYKDARMGKSFVVDRKRSGVKEAKLEYTPLSKAETENGPKTLIEVRLHTGRFHQIRAQLSSRKLPIVGDGKYGSRDNKARFPALFAFRLTFEIEGKAYEFKKMPDIENYPWSIFNYD